MGCASNFALAEYDGGRSNAYLLYTVACDSKSMDKSALFDSQMRLLSILRFGRAWLGKAGLEPRSSIRGAHDG